MNGLLWFLSSVIGGVVSATVMGIIFCKVTGQDIRPARETRKAGRTRKKARYVECVTNVKGRQ